MMFWAVVAFLLVVCLLPVTFQFDMTHGEDSRWRVMIRCWLIHKELQGKETKDKNGQAHSRRRYLPALLQTDKRAIRYLLARIHLQLNVQAFLQTGDAAQSALFVGALRTLCACIPSLHRKELRIQLLPEFFREYSTINLRCMFCMKLGTLILTAMLLCLKYFQTHQQKESEAMQYGTSHW